MYTELLIFTEPTSTPREQRTLRSSRQARAFVAMACDNHPVNPAIFSRDADGKTRQGTILDAASNEAYGIAPLIFFGGGRGLIRITALGPEGRALLEANTPLIYAAISLNLGRPCQFRLNQGNCSLQRSYPHLYYVPEVSLIKKGQRIARHVDEQYRASLESCHCLILKAIRGGLISQSTLLDQQDGGNRLAAIGTDEEMGIEVLQGYPFIDKMQSKGGQVFLNIRHLVFSIDMDLTGPWLIGRLRSQGLGLVSPHRTHIQQDVRHQQNTPVTA